MDLKNFFIGVAIFILTVSVGIYGINTFYGPEPKYENYCPSIITKEQCINVSGIWINNTAIYDKAPPMPGNAVPVDSGYCNYDYNRCQKTYNDARESYSKGVFFIALPLGIIVLAIGSIVFGIATVGGGLTAGGVGILIFGVVQFWEFAQDYIKFGLSLLGLIILIWLAYYINKKFSKPEKKK